MCRPTFLPKTSGHLRSMTTRRDRCCRPTHSFRRSGATTRASSRTMTDPTTSTSAPLRRKARKATGSRPCPARAGTRSSGSTGRSSPGSIRHGVLVRLNCSNTRDQMSSSGLATEWPRTQPLDESILAHPYLRPLSDWRGAGIPQALA